MPAPIIPVAVIRAAVAKRFAVPARGPERHRRGRSRPIAGDVFVYLVRTMRRRTLVETAAELGISTSTARTVVIRISHRRTVDPELDRTIRLIENGARRAMTETPISRLQFARDEIDRVLGPGYAAAHPDVVVAVMQSAASDFMALAVARAIGEVAAALLVEDQPEQGQAMSIVRAQGLMRP